MRTRAAERRVSLVTCRAIVLGLAVLLGGCKGGHHFDPPSREKQVAQADSAYSPAIFDTIAWPSDSAREFDGNNTYAARCRKCHGELGEGGTPYAIERNLNPPSLVRPGWPYGDDIEKVRHRIFIGHPGGMPTWGVAGITPREIDAVAYYIVKELRPEMLKK